MPENVAQDILDALRDRRVTRLKTLDDGTLSIIWNQSGLGSPQSARNGVELADLLGAVIRRIEGAR